MKYYRVLEQFGKIHLCAETSDGVLTSLTSVNDLVNSYEDLLDVADISGITVDNLTKNVLAQGKAVTFDLAELIKWSINKTGPACIIKPIEPEEMWAGGLGNMIMDEEALSNANEDTKLAYNTPSISTTIYKGTNHRLVGPFDKIGIREDTERTIAEGEIVFIIYKGKFAGISTGNEVAGTLAGLSSNWAVPSKVFKGCLYGSLALLASDRCSPVIILSSECALDGSDKSKPNATIAIIRVWYIDLNIFFSLVIRFVNFPETSS